MEQDKDEHNEIEEKNKEQDNTMLYIMIGIVLFILFVWLIIALSSGKSDPIKILGAMNNRLYHIPASSDN